MRRSSLLQVVLAATVIVGACSDTPGTVDASSLPGSGEVSDAVTELQTEMSELANQIQSSDAADELQSAWGDLQAEISSGIAALTSDGVVDTDALQAEFDEFETQLDGLGDDVGDEVVDAWNELRSQLEQLFG
jgi:hypothetical protein